MQYYVDSSSGAVIGVHYGEPVEPPDGWLLIEGPDGNPTDVFYDETGIQLKPEKPTVTAYWHSELKEWREPEPLPEPPKPPSWGGFYKDFLTTAAYSVILEVSAQSLEANTVFTNLSNALLLASQGFANINAIQSAFDSLLSLTEFTEDDKLEVLDLVEQHSVSLNVQ